MHILTQKNLLFNKITKILFVLFLLNCLNVFSQNTIKFEHLTTENGLSQSDVNTIFQDKDGFMWLGTHDGLNRYDGYNFKVFKPNSKNKESISSNLIWKIIDDKNGDLWIGTTGGGLSYFNRETETFINFKHDSKNDNSIKSNYITLLFRDSSNRLWVGTSEGLDVIDLNKPIDSISVQHFNIYQNNIEPASNRNNVNSIFEDSMQQIWIGKENGLSKLSRDKNGEPYFQPMNNHINLPSCNVKTITEDSYGNLILGTSKGMFRFCPNDKSSEKIQLIHQGLFTIIASNKDQIWAGTNNGLFEFSNKLGENNIPKLVNTYKYDPKNPTYSLSKNTIKSIYIDNSNIIWVGTNGGGINKFDTQRKQFSHLKKNLELGSISNDKIRSIFEDSNQNLWIGTEGGGLNLLSKENIDKNYNKFQNFEKVTNVFAIEEIDLIDSKKLFIGGESVPGLFELDFTNDKKITDNDFKEVKGIFSSIFSIHQDKDKNIWIGSYNGGVLRWLLNSDDNSFNKDNLKHDPNNEFSISNNIIRNIFQDSKGNVWFATGNGLSRLKPDQITSKNPKFDIFKNNPKDDSTISHNYILTTFESKSGDIWIGTFGGGLNKLIPASNTKPISFKNYKKNNGLPNNVIKSILEDNQGNLWLSTNKGLCKFNPLDETFHVYDVNDGLQSNEFSELAAFKTKDGEMLFGGVNGFNAFYPENIINNNIKPQTVFTSFTIFNKPVQIGKKINGRVILEKSINSVNEIQLKYNENNFSFEFAALHYAASKKNKYAYKLEGFNEDWIYTTANNRNATYTNLEPGNYTLKVKASNNDNIWDETPIKIKITVIPPWWRTSFAKFIYLLLTILVFLAFRRYTIISTTKKHHLEIEHLEKEKNEEIQRLKLEFFTNISHEFRTPLTLIKGPLDYLLKKGDTLNKKEVNDQYNLMRKNIEFLLRLVNQLLDFRKMDHGKMSLNLSKSNIVEFLKEVGEPFQILSLKKNINFDVISSKNTIQSWFDADALEKIVNNLLSNAFKFTPNDGTISLDIFDGKDFIKPISISVDIDQSKYVVIQVKDSGPGIPTHRIQNIFERFYSDMNITKSKLKGTGIGLSFTKKLVELHQGVIKVKSDSQSGSTFIVWLPKEKEDYKETSSLNFHEVFESNTFITQEDADSHALSVIDDILDNNIIRSRSKLPVLLIIDDNPDIRSFIKKGLGDSYYIYEAENGEQGLEMANKFIPNIVITDLIMPVLDGIEFCNRLKTTKETSHIPVVMLTAKISQEKEIEGLKTGADAYIRKPFDMELLELKLANILKHREELRKRFNREITLQPKDVTVTSSDEIFLQIAIEVVEKQMMNSDFSVEMLVKEMNMSRSNLYLKIKDLTGLSSSEFIRNIRLKRAVQLFDKSDLSVKEIMYMTGFNTASYFSKCFKKQFGVIPSKYIRITENTNFEENSL
jgi:signal transduction histidine kinase/ligand-binding sensor domain-containing protein/DNA-binding response OmpR family regulator